MNCPKCNNKMEIMYRPEAERIRNGELVEVLGRCEDCDFDAMWKIKTVYASGGDIVAEYDMKRYFFG